MIFRSAFAAFLLLSMTVFCQDGIFGEASVDVGRGEIQMFSDHVKQVDRYSVLKNMGRYETFWSYWNSVAVEHGESLDLEPITFSFQDYFTDRITEDYYSALTKISLEVLELGEYEPDELLELAGGAYILIEALSVPGEVRLCLWPGCNDPDPPKCCPCEGDLE